MAFLKDQFPDVGNIKNNFDSLIEKLAQKESQSKEVYAANWMRSQMGKLIELLQGKVRVKGEQRDLDTAISNCAKILPYFKSVKCNTLKEDLLLKLAVEGGDYCARGIKRTSGEIVDDLVIPNGQPDSATALADPQKNYEIKIRQALQNARLGMIQEVYNQIRNQLRIPSEIANDVHAFDIYRKALSLGFYPMTEHERNGLQVSDLMIWFQFSPIRQQMLQGYSHVLDATITGLGELHFTTYMRQIIDANDRLSSEEKAALEEKWSSHNDGTWTEDQTNTKFHRLMLVMLGIIQKKE